MLINNNEKLKRTMRYCNKVIALMPLTLAWQGVWVEELKCCMAGCLGWGAQVLHGRVSGLRSSSVAWQGVWVEADAVAVDAYQVALRPSSKLCLQKWEEISNNKTVWHFVYRNIKLTEIFFPWFIFFQLILVTYLRKHEIFVKHISIPCLSDNYFFEFGITYICIHLNVTSLLFCICSPNPWVLFFGVGSDAKKRIFWLRFFFKFTSKSKKMLWCIDIHVKCLIYNLLSTYVSKM